MKKTISNIILPVDSCNEDAVEKAIKKSGVSRGIITKAYISKKSIDARRGNVNFVYSVTVEYPPIEKAEEQQINYGTEKLNHGIIVVGSGPAGLFCAYILAKNGYRPLLLERGQEVYKREKTIGRFYSSGSLNENSNVQFGEGGAGAFSDGKLTTRVNDKRADIVLEAFVKNGAKEEILYDKKAHIGTDMLKDIVANMRKEIIACGGRVLFNTTVTDVVISNDRLIAVVTNQGEMPCDKAVFAIGHSARDTYEMLYNKGVLMCAKAFAMGYRVEHKREFIDASQYGRFAGHKNLGAADYRLVYNGKDRSCFSFCMCPGGYVVGAASECGGIVVNGMSENSRDGENSNSAIVAQVTPEDYGNGVLDGIKLQRKYEQAAYSLTDSYVAPVQRVSDFISGAKTTALGDVKPTYPLGYRFADLSALMPSYAVRTIKEGLADFNNKIKGFADVGVLTGVETRTSAPLRILRNELMESINLKNLMPIGEGAGYAGGIMSAAIDGIKAAERIMETYDRD